MFVVVLFHVGRICATASRPSTSCTRRFRSIVLLLLLLQLFLPLPLLLLVLLRQCAQAAGAPFRGRFVERKQIAAVRRVGRAERCLVVKLVAAIVVAHSAAARVLVIEIFVGRRHAEILRVRRGRGAAVVTGRRRRGRRGTRVSAAPRGRRLGTRAGRACGGSAGAADGGAVICSNGGSSSRSHCRCRGNGGR